MNSVILIVILTGIAGLCESYSNSRILFHRRKTEYHESNIDPNRLQSNENEYERLRIRASLAKTFSEALEILNITVDPLSSRTNIFRVNDGATCEPEMRTITLPVHKTGRNLYYPQCVRLPRCGGCCDGHGRYECVPTKIVQRDIHVMQIEIGRKDPEMIPTTLSVDVHDECECRCKVKKETCNADVHIYDPVLCLCKCIEKDEERKQCSPVNGKPRFWDLKTCSCRCTKQRRCPSGSVFSNEICG